MCKLHIKNNVLGPMCFLYQKCGLGQNVSVSSWSQLSRRTNVWSRSRLGQNSKRLGFVCLENMRLRSRFGLGSKGLVHIPVLYVVFVVFSSEYNAMQPRD